MYKINNIVTQQEQEAASPEPTNQPKHNINIDLNNINIQQTNNLNYNTNHHSRKLSLINDNDNMYINHNPSINYFLSIQTLQNDTQFNEFLNSLNITYSDSYYNLTKLIPLITSIQSCNLNYIRFEQMIYKNNQINVEKLNIEDSKAKKYRKQVYSKYILNFYENLKSLINNSLNNLYLLKDKDLAFNNNILNLLIIQLVYLKFRLKGFYESQNYKIHHLKDGYGEFDLNEKFYSNQLSIDKKLGGGTYSKVYMVKSVYPNYMHFINNETLNQVNNQLFQYRIKNNHKKIINNDGVLIEIDINGNEYVLLDHDDDEDVDFFNQENYDIDNNYNLNRFSNISFNNFLNNCQINNIDLTSQDIFIPILLYNNIFNSDHYELGDEFLFYLGQHFYQTFLINNPDISPGYNNLLDFKNFVETSFNSIFIATSYFIQYDHSTSCETCKQYSHDLKDLLNTIQLELSMTNSYTDIISCPRVQMKLSKYSCLLVTTILENITSSSIFTNSFIFKNQIIFDSCIYFWISDMNIWKFMFGYFDGNLPNMPLLPNLNHTKDNNIALYDTAKMSRENGIINAYLLLMCNIDNLNVFPFFNNDDYSNDTDNQIFIRLIYGRFFSVNDDTVPYESQYLNLLTNPEKIYQPDFPYSDDSSSNTFALKIIRYIDKYRIAARQELLLLYLIKEKDPQRIKNCLIIDSSLDMKGHIMILAPYYPCSVFDFSSSNALAYFPLSHTKLITKQLFEAINFLHSLGFIHTDLKPENMVFETQDLLYSYRISNTLRNTLSNRRLKASDGVRKLLKTPKIVLIDFGTSLKIDSYHPDIICTRHYRAPEVILGYEYDLKSDVWSLGCILYEFIIGEVLFHMHNNEAHLIMIQMFMNMTLRYNINKSKFKNLKVYSKNYSNQLNKDTKAIKYLFNAHDNYDFNWDLFINPNIESSNSLIEQNRSNELLIDENRCNYELKAKEIIETTKRLDITITSKLKYFHEVNTFDWLELINFEKILNDNWKDILVKNQEKILTNEMFIFDYDYHLSTHLCLPTDISLDELFDNQIDLSFMNFDCNLKFYNNQFFYLKQIMIDHFNTFDNVESLDKFIINKIMTSKSNHESYKECLSQFDGFKDELFKALNLKNSKCLDYKLFKSWYLFIDLLRCCFVINEHERLSISELLEHPFFKDNKNNFDEFGNEIKSHISNSGMFGYDNDSSSDEKTDSPSNENSDSEIEEIYELEDNVMIWDVATMVMYFDKLVMYWYLKEL